MKSIVFISSVVDLPGPCFSPNGQSIITSTVYDFMTSRFRVHSISHGKKLISQISYIFTVIPSIFAKFFASDISFSYIVISRSRFGFIRDSLVIFYLCLFRKTVYIHFHGQHLPGFLSSSFVFILSSSPLRRYLHLILPSISFLENNPSWSLFAYSEIPNFCACNSSNLHFSDSDGVNSLHSQSTIKPQKKFLKITWNSNLIFSKGITHLVEAIFIFNSTSTTHAFHLDIFGSFCDDEFCSASELESVVLGLTSHIPCSFYGSVSRSTTFSSLQSSDLYVFPSFYSSEYQPLSLMDAMACGLPIISTSLPCLKHLLRDYPDVTFLPVRPNPYTLAKYLHTFLGLVERRDMFLGSSSSRSRIYSRDDFINSLLLLTSST